MSILFISHSAPDHEIAKALEKAIEGFLGEKRIEIHYSSSATQGPAVGEDWRAWIEKTVLKSKTVLVVLSRESIKRSWPIWESGAAQGVASSRAEFHNQPESEVSPKIMALTYGITKDECPDPLKKEQIFSGEKTEEIRQVFINILLSHAGHEDSIMAGEKLSPAITEYSTKIQSILLDAPSIINEPNIQDWLVRLDDLAANKRWSELPNFQYWMNIAFGHKEESPEKEIDIRLHRRLGDYYLGQEKYELAIEQLRLARKTAPRDIYVLTRLSEALIKNLLNYRNEDALLRDEIEKLLERIKTLDAEVIYQNPDSAALEAKYERRIKKDLNKAIKIYEKSLKKNPNSYYLMDVLGQTYIENHQDIKAQQIYEKALNVINKLQDHNIWSLATQSTANLVLKNYEAAEQSLIEIKNLSPAPSINQITSVKKGIINLCVARNIATSIKQKLAQALGTEH